MDVPHHGLLFLLVFLWTFTTTSITDKLLFQFWALISVKYGGNARTCFCSICLRAVQSWDPRMHSAKSSHSNSKAQNQGYPSIVKMLFFFISSTSCNALHFQLLWTQALPVKEATMQESWWTTGMLQSAHHTAPEQRSPCPFMADMSLCGEDGAFSASRRTRRRCQCAEPHRRFQEKLMHWLMYKQTLCLSVKP